MKFMLNRERTSPLRHSICLSIASLCLPSAAHAQDAGTLPMAEKEQVSRPRSATAADERASIEAELRELQVMRQQFDSRIDALEARLGLTHDDAVAPSTAPQAATGRGITPGIPQSSQTQPHVATAQQPLSELPQTGAPPADAPAKGGFAGFMDRQEKTGKFDENKGFVLAQDELGELDLSFMAYARYVNATGLKDTYQDSLGRIHPIDIRNEIQLNKVSINFKGWLFDPKFQYLLFAWTNNANQGEGAQVVLAGFLRYKFADWLSVSAGIMPLPTTRSTNYSFPKWLRHDNRVMADEFYRGSYTSGIDAMGTIATGLQYRVMLGNNLSTLGVSSKELDSKLDTVSGALWWMPTTGEYGLANGFGDYDYHEEVATLAGIHLNHSTETAQGQPSENDFENSQIRLTDGTLLFSPDPFGTGGQIEKARWQMASIDLGAKYKGFSLEAQYYWRKVDNFKTIGYVPITKVEDEGLAVQASAMPIKDLLQTYVTYSKIWGANGDPTEWAIGANLYPFKRRGMQINLEAIRLNHSPVGGYHMPIPVGGDGWVFLTDWIVMF